MPQPDYASSRIPAIGYGPVQQLLRRYGKSVRTVKIYFTREGTGSRVSTRIAFDRQHCLRSSWVLFVLLILPALSAAQTAADSAEVVRIVAEFLGPESPGRYVAADSLCFRTFAPGNG
jgi:hypothetical protein